MIKKTDKNSDQFNIEVHESVKDYYGRVLNTKNDLKTSACCDADSFPEYLKKPLSLIADEILTKFYGCGSPLPLGLKNAKVLDLGCGTGRDVYLASYLVGGNGEVVGVDMTEEQLSVANKYTNTQMGNFGYSKTNVQFVKGYIEELENLDLKDNYFDVVISNCVLNLSPKKDKVLKQVYRVLKPGGEFYFSDVYADRRLPTHFQKDPVLLGECLGGALYWKDFERLAIKTGFHDPRAYSRRLLEIKDSEVLGKIKNIMFSSIGYRLFKIPELEDACEDFGHSVVYKGNLEHSQSEFYLDDHHIFPKNKKISVCGNTYLMLHNSRFKDNFNFSGDFSEHKGLFDCSPKSENDIFKTECSGPGCC